MPPKNAGLYSRLTKNDRMTPSKPIQPAPRGFTLVEVLVVVAILAILAALTFGVSSRAIRAAEKVKCVNLIREIEVPMAAYQTDSLRPILPEHKEDEDTIFGDQNGFYSNAFIVAVLTGDEDAEFEETTGETFDVSYLNPSGTIYLDPEHATMDGLGLREDGMIYDPWGETLVFAVNSRIRRTGENNGYRDEILHTYGLAEYADTRPGYREFAIWSYGQDKVIGRAGAPLSNELPVFAGSDDVKSW